jgi:hypothetical protein
MASTSERVSQLQKALAEAQIQNGILADEVTTVHEELRTLREPNQPSPVPLVLRIQKAGVEVPLPQARKSDEPQETSSVPVEAKIASAAGGPAPQDAPPAPPRSEPPPVVVASLPESIQPLPVAKKPGDQAKAPTDAAGKASPPAESAQPDDHLTSRAEELFHKGDVSGARLLLQRSLENGNARAAFLMAETFDPNVLSKLRVLGIRGDVAKAQEFYAQALALGIPEAGTRMQALK